LKRPSADAEKILAANKRNGDAIIAEAKVQAQAITDKAARDASEKMENLRGEQDACKRWAADLASADLQLKSREEDAQNLEAALDDRSAKLDTREREVERREAEIRRFDDWRKAAPV
jgi:hypothetical protein